MGKDVIIALDFDSREKTLAFLDQFTDRKPFVKIGMELCVLALLHKRDCYGYEISEFLSQHIEIAGGTVYPILRKLKADGLLTTYLQEESGGPPRKYYKLTELGRETYQKDRAEYLKFAQSVRNLLEDENDDKK